jgi:hypothetical protein
MITVTMIKAFHNLYLLCIHLTKYVFITSDIKYDSILPTIWESNKLTKGLLGLEVWGRIAGEAGHK